MTDQNEMYDEDLSEGSLAADSLKAGSKSFDDPKSKVEYITAMIGAMHTMKKDDLVSWYNQTMAQFGPGKEYGVGDKVTTSLKISKKEPKHFSKQQLMLALLLKQLLLKKHTK